MRLSPLAFGVALSVVACAPAFAQQQGMPNIQMQRQMKFGASVVESYDSNVARSDSATARLRGIHPVDYTLTPSIRASIVQTLGRQALFLDGSAGYDFHNNNHQLNRQRGDVTGGFAAMFAGCQEEVYSNFRAQQSDLADITTGTAKNLQKASGVAAGATCGKGVGLGGTFLVQREDIKNSAATQKFNDVTVRTLSSQISYARPSLATIGLVYNYSQNQFPNRINPGRPVGDSFQVQSYGVEIDKTFTSKLRADATVTRTQVKREFAPPGLPLKSNLTAYSADVFYGLGARINLEAHATRAVQPSDRVGKLYDIQKTGEILGRYRLGSRIQLTSGYRIENTDSNADTNVQTPAPVIVLTKSRMKTIYGTVRYRQSERLTLSLDVRHDTRDTNVPSFNYTSDRVSLTAEASF